MLAVAEKVTVVLRVVSPIDAETVAVPGEVLLFRVAVATPEELVVEVAGMVPRSVDQVTSWFTMATLVVWVLAIMVTVAVEVPLARMLLLFEASCTLRPSRLTVVDSLRPEKEAVTVAEPAVLPALRTAVASPLVLVVPWTVIETSSGPVRAKATSAPWIGLPAGVSRRARTVVVEEPSAAILAASEVTVSTGWTKSWYRVSINVTPSLARMVSRATVVTAEVRSTSAEPYSSVVALEVILPCRALKFNVAPETFRPAVVRTRASMVAFDTPSAGSWVLLELSEMITPSNTTVSSSA